MMLKINQKICINKSSN